MIKIYRYDEMSLKIRQKIMRRAQADMAEIHDYVVGWLEKVRKKGDKAVLEYVRKFDDANFESNKLRVTEKEIKEAYAKTAPDVLKAMKEQIRISRAFHEKQASMIEPEWQIETVPGVITGAKKVPIDAVGLYVPAGKAPLPTVAQILTVAAAAAGVPRKVVCFAPTGAHHEIIAAAAFSGADEIYRVGGIAAIAALTFGTETIKPVNKIVGPGNPYVQSAKLQVVDKVGIDMLSGPSEALIIADSSANPAFIAADILARCEHGPDSAAVVVTDSPALAEKISAQVAAHLPDLSRQNHIKKALKAYSAIIIVDSPKQMVDFANEYAAEHLEIQTRDPKKVFAKIRNAGSVFLGPYSPVAIGDYASGTNHCLPTGVAPKFASPIGVETFLKTIEFQSLTKKGLKSLQPIIQTIAQVEGLDAHRESVNIRLK